MFYKYATSKVIDIGDWKRIIRPKEAFSRQRAKNENDLLKYGINTDDFGYVRNRAVSASEYHGPNDNRDGYPEKDHHGEGLHENYATLISRGVYHNHNSDNPKLAYGFIVDSMYNAANHWVENLLAIDKTAKLQGFHKTIWAMIENGDILETSIGCIVDHTHCSECGAKFEDASQFCAHVLNGDAYEECHGVCFTEDSILTEPAADREAIILEKVAKKKLWVPGIRFQEVPKELKQEARERYEKKAVQTDSTDTGGGMGGGCLTCSPLGGGMPKKVEEGKKVYDDSYKKTEPEEKESMDYKSPEELIKRAEEIFRNGEAMDMDEALEKARKERTNAKEPELANGVFYEGQEGVALAMREEEDGSNYSIGLPLGKVVSGIKTEALLSNNKNVKNIAVTDKSGQYTIYGYRLEKMPWEIVASKNSTGEFKHIAQYKGKEAPTEEVLRVLCGGKGILTQRLAKLFIEGDGEMKRKKRAGEVNIDRERDITAKPEDVEGESLSPESLEVPSSDSELDVMPKPYSPLSDPGRNLDHEKDIPMDKPEVNSEKNKIRPDVDPFTASLKQLKRNQRILSKQIAKIAEDLEETKEDTMDLVNHDGDEQAPDMVRDIKTPGEKELLRKQPSVTSITNDSQPAETTMDLEQEGQDRTTSPSVPRESASDRELVEYQASLYRRKGYKRNAAWKKALRDAKRAGLNINRILRKKSTLEDAGYNLDDETKKLSYVAEYEAGNHCEEMKKAMAAMATNVLKAMTGKSGFKECMEAAQGGDSREALITAMKEGMNRETNRHLQEAFNNAMQKHMKKYTMEDKEETPMEKKKDMSDEDYEDMEMKEKPEEEMNETPEEEAKEKHESLRRKKLRKASLKNKKHNFLASRVASVMLKSGIKKGNLRELTNHYYKLDRETLRELERTASLAMKSKTEKVEILEPKFKIQKAGSLIPNRYSQARAEDKDQDLKDLFSGSVARPRTMVR